MNQPDTTDHQAQRTEELRPWFHDMYLFPFTHLTRLNGQALVFVP